MFEDGFVQQFFGAVVVIHHHLFHPGHPGDLAGARSVVAQFGKKPGGGLEDPAPGSIQIWNRFKDQDLVGMLF